MQESHITHDTNCEQFSQFAIRLWVFATILDALLQRTKNESNIIWLCIVSHNSYTPNLPCQGSQAP